MRLIFLNQWQRPPEGRDLTWFGIEQSTFTVPYNEANIHVFVLGLGVIWWYRGRG